MDLIFGGGELDRRVSAAEALLRDWREKERDWGQLYLTYVPITPRDRLVVEDLAVTMLLNSQVAAAAARAVALHGDSLDLRALPEKPLEATTEVEREGIASLIGDMTAWPGILTSVATKTLHKKRPALIPVLDNRAIFDAYRDPRWPDRHTVGEGTGNIARIKEALDSIAYDLVRPENAMVWPRLHELEPERSRIELFDMVWWMYFRRLEPR